MTFTDAAIEVLRLVGKPLHYKEITDLAIERNLLSHVGKSPEVTMGARLAALMKKEAGDNPLLRVKPGVFGLRDWDAATVKAGSEGRKAGGKKAKVEEAVEADLEVVADDSPGAGDAPRQGSLQAPRAAESLEAASLEADGAEDADDDEVLFGGDSAGTERQHLAVDDEVAAEVAAVAAGVQGSDARAAREPAPRGGPPPRRAPRAPVDVHVEHGPDAAMRAAALGASEIFDEEEDDDEPILGGTDEAAQVGGDGRRRRRRRRRGRGGDVVPASSADGMPAYTATPVDAAPQGIEARDGRDSGRDANRDGGRDQGRDAGGRDSAGRDSAGRDAAGRDSAGRDSAGRDSAGRDAAGRDLGREPGREPQARESGREGREPRDRRDGREGRDRGEPRVDREPRGDGRESREVREAREGRGPQVLDLLGSEQLGADDLAGRDMADVVSTLLGGFDRSAGPISLRQLAEALQRRSRGGGDVQLLSSQIAAAVRADNARRGSSGLRPRFRFAGGRVGSTDWLLGNDLLTAEREALAAVERYREAARRAFARRVAELPGHSFVELVVLALEKFGVGNLRAVRRPGSANNEAHLAGRLRGPGEDFHVGIVVRRDGREIGRERVTELRGALHHYGPAQAGFLFTSGQVLSGAREEAASTGAAPVALHDGASFARLCEENEVAVVRTRVPIAVPDVDLLEALRAS